jgi:hypothetical protein
LFYQISSNNRYRPYRILVVFVISIFKAVNRAKV